MQYLASIGGGCGVGIEDEVLHTNVILEAFGNAKTSRNGNSSRFVCLSSLLFIIQIRIFWAIGLLPSS